MKRLLWLTWYVATGKMEIVGFHFGRNGQKERGNSESAEEGYVYTTVVINLKSKRSALSLKKHLWLSFDRN
ncbi:hypothetical protein LIX87_08545 [Weissella viridescens]|uniref:hypothetical protein n=1 Tax=Weissella viridescens TaxID=1629 RepID=UPI001D089AAE|nr:hypothetical protein [Weissella viridescens]MCB6841022.1 hypothetical protein [Weissella viridescens]MCB6847757.1 hypothetical protein [Weissella viridescens]